MSNFLGDVISVGSLGLLDGGDLTGANAADAAKRAASVQAAAGEDSIAFQRESRDLARNDLSPFRDFGANQISGVNQLLDPQGQANFLQGNPLFQSAVDNTSQDIKNIAAATGKTGGSLVEDLFSNYLSTGQNFIQQNLNNRFNAVNVGQSAAAGQANTALTTGQGIGNTLLGIGNSNAAGIVGRQNAQTQAFNGILNAGAQVAGAFF